MSYSRKNRRQRRRRQNRRRTIERLEPRQLMAADLADSPMLPTNVDDTQADVAQLSVTLIDGKLSIIGTDGDDNITVRQRDGLISITGHDKTFDALAINEIVVLAGDGDDVVDLDSGAVVGEEAIQIRASVDGGSGNDTIRGGAAADRLYGGAGLDQIFGGAGDDWLFGGMADDNLYGGSGNDRLFGNSGNDQLLGENGNDQLTGGDGDDRLVGGNGHDYLGGNCGRDQLFGNLGNDNLNGGSGNDVLVGGAGDDRLLGGDGNDQLSGNTGRDRLFGHGGDDVLQGGTGDDTLIGGADNDRLLGGDGHDVLHGGDGNDRLYAHSGNDQLHGGSGDDVLAGGEGDDDMDGGDGVDTLDGVQEVLSRPEDRSYVLESGNLYDDSPEGRELIATDIRQFDLDPRNRLVLLDTQGRLSRSQKAFGEGGYTQIGGNFRKFVVGSDGRIVGLTFSATVFREGGWSGQPYTDPYGHIAGADIALDVQGRLIVLSEWGVLTRSQEALGDGGWEQLGSDVLKYLVTSDGHVLILEADGSVRWDGVADTVRDNQSDIALDQQERVLLLGRNGQLNRSVAPRGESGWEQLGAEIIEFVITSDDRIVMLAGDGYVYVNGYPKEAQQSIVDIGLDAQGRPLMLGAMGHLYELDPSKLTDVEVDLYLFPHKAENVAKFMLAPDGRLWTLHGDGLLRIDGEQAMGNYADIASDRHGTMYLLREDGRLERLAPFNPLDQLQTALYDVRAFAVNPNGSVWTLQRNGVLGTATAGGYFAAISSGYEQIEQSRDGTLYLLKNDRTLTTVAPYILTLNPDAFQVIASGVTEFIIGPDDRVWTLHNDGWLRIDGHDYSAGSKYMAGGRGGVYVLMQGGTLATIEPFRGAQQIASNVREFTVTRNGMVRILHLDGWTAEQYPWSKFGHKLGSDYADIAQGDDGALYMLRTNGRLEKADTSLFVSDVERQIIASNVRKFALTPSGHVWTLHTDGSLRVDGTQIANAYKDLAQLPDDVLLLLKDNGTLEKAAATLPLEPEVMASGVVKFFVGADGSVYHLRKDGHLFVDTQLVRSGTKDFQIAADGNVYWLGTTGAFERRLMGSNNWDTIGDDVREFKFTGGELHLVRGTSSSIREEQSSAFGNIRPIIDPSNHPVSGSMLVPVGRVLASRTDGKVSKGTGTLLAAGGNFFVVTAKHVVANAKKGGIEFRISTGEGYPFDVQTIPVCDVFLHPTLDLALLRLTNSVRGLQGAVLPRGGVFSALNGNEVMIVGYGNTGNGRTGEQDGTGGIKRYGFTHIDDVTGPYLAFRFDRNQGESAIAHEDSGGPVFTHLDRILRYGRNAGKKVRIPVLLGVHKGGDGTQYGSWQYSTAITQGVASWLYARANPLVRLPKDHPCVNVAANET